MREQGKFYVAYDEGIARRITMANGRNGHSIISFHALPDSVKQNLTVEQFRSWKHVHNERAEAICKFINDKKLF